MSDTDSFIEEVTEEVRREQLYGYLKRYGWIAVVLVLGIVGTAAFLEWQKAQTTATAQAIGDSVLGAMENDEASDRLNALTAIDAESVEAAALVSMLTAREAEVAGDVTAAIAALESVATNGSLPLEYSQLAALKSLMLQHETLSADDRRIRYEALATPGAPYRMLALEQLALISAEHGDIASAVEQLEAIRLDAETSEGLRARATQLIVALGETPSDVNDIPLASGN
ncbi:MAG: hypothetical protein P8L68_01370 [Paracoccaceae bacterium]|nr:hypothetical protein [Paracoccaceae bacterium]MDG2257129.1 hypothetical protein [Paracoccaceae bacterium]